MLVEVLLEVVLSGVLLDSEVLEVEMLHVEYFESFDDGHFQSHPRLFILIL